MSKITIPTTTRGGRRRPWGNTWRRFEIPPKRGSGSGWGRSIPPSRPPRRTTAPPSASAATGRSSISRSTPAGIRTLRQFQFPPNRGELSGCSGGIRKRMIGEIEGGGEGSLKAVKAENQSSPAVAQGLGEPVPLTLSSWKEIWDGEVLTAIMEMVDRWGRRSR
ncbi:unnamed protein product [Linum trigynum]|uniref:Uncharacterized protein n=1 Tax=Linum trigynum TaxID=586398 RepID=A0AAV2F3C9_9ROSI